MLIVSGWSFFLPLATFATSSPVAGLFT